MMKIVIGWKSKNSRLNRSFQRKRRDRLISWGSSKFVYFFKTNIIHHRNDKTMKTASFALHSTMHTLIYATLEEVVMIYAMKASGNML